MSEVLDTTSTNPERLIIFAGPTSVGKSSIARDVAAATNGVIVNSDKYYLYDVETFSSGVGLEPGELADGHDRRLYGVLDPHEPLPAPDEYLAALAKPAIDELLASGRSVVVEGCTFGHSMLLADQYGADRVVGVRYGDRDQVSAHINARIDSLVDAGLFEETERNLAAGLGDTFPMRKGVLYRIARQYLERELNRRDAIAAMQEIMLSLVDQHTAFYRRLRAETWITTPVDNRTSTVAQLIERLKLG